MDNLTHSLVGLAAAKAGLERTSPYATALCVIAANAPDADVLMLFADEWVYLKHHRGITHSIAGTLAIALILPLVFYAADLLIARLRGRRPRARPLGLLLSSLVLSASHPLLDWTNNYGVRPFLPWSSDWYYGDLVFIMDPWLWLSIGGAAFLLTARTWWRTFAWVALGALLTAAILFLPPLAGMPYPLTSRALWLAGIAGLVVAHRLRLAARFGPSIALTSLALVVVYWGALSIVHAHALARARLVGEELARQSGERLLRVAAMPTLADPLRWRCVAETERAMTRFELELSAEQGSDALEGVSRFEKPEGEAALLVAEAARDPRAEILLDFARFPAARVQRDCLGETRVQFADLRYTEPGPSRRGGNFALEVSVPPAR